MRIETRRARADEVAAFYGKPMEYHMVALDGEAVAMGGIVEVNGRVWGFLDVKDGIPARGGLAVVKGIRAWLRGYGAEVRVCEHSSKYPDAARLLALVGFELTDEVWDGMRVWACRDCSN